MNEIVDFDEIKKMREKEDRVSIYWTNSREKLLYLKIHGEEYHNITPEEVIQRFGTNYNLIQEFRNLLEHRSDVNAEKILQNNQSVKKEIIDIFVTLMGENDIFDGKLSVQEIKTRLDKNLDAVYIVDDAYRENVGGWYNGNSKNIYIKTEKPEELKEAIINGNIENILGDDLLKICHESIHALSPNGLRISGNGTIYGTAINEGMVEFLAEKMISERIQEHEKSSGVYSEQVKTTKNLLAIYGQSMIDAYISGNITPLINSLNSQSIESFSEYLFVSDYILALEESEKSDPSLLKNLKERQEEAIINLVNTAEIDISNVIENSIKLPDPIIRIVVSNYLKSEDNEKEVMLRKFFANRECWKQLEGDTWESIINSITEYSKKQNNGLTNLEDYSKFGIINIAGAHWCIADNFWNKNDIDLQSVLENLSELIKTSTGINGDVTIRLRDTVEELLKKGIDKQYTEEEQKTKKDRIEAKKRIISAICHDAGFSQEKLISSIMNIENLEYYMGPNKRPMVINKNSGEIEELEFIKPLCEINKEDISQLPLILQKERIIDVVRDYRNEKEIYATTMDEKGNYILKSYLENENGEFEEVDMGLGRNFLDDTTYIDRELMKKTENVKTSGIKSTIEEMKSLYETREKQKFERKGEIRERDERDD